MMKYILKKERKKTPINLKFHYKINLRSLKITKSNILVIQGGFTIRYDRDHLPRP